MGCLAYLPLNPLGGPAPYAAKVIFLKAKKIQPTRPPKASCGCSHRLLHSAIHLPGLTTLIMPPTFLRFHLGEKEKRKKKTSLNLIILTAPGVVFVILWLTGRARERRGSEEKRCKSAPRPEPDIRSQFRFASASDEFSGFGGIISRLWLPGVLESLHKYASLKVHLLVAPC